MYNVTVTLLKEQGVGKKRVDVFKEATEYGWMEQPMFFVDHEGTYHYYNAYEVQCITANEIKKETLHVI